LQKRYSRYSSGQTDHTLSFGAAVSVDQYRLNGNDLQPNTPGDPDLAKSLATKVFPDASFGVYYKYKDLVYAGLSVPQIMGLNIDYQSPNGSAAIKTVQHLNLLAGGKIPWDRDKFSIDPVVGFMWVNGAPPQGVIGARFNILKTFFIGINYRSVDYMVFEAGFNVKQLVFFAYSYDLNVSSYRPNVGSTQEVCISFKVPKSGRVWRGTGPALRF
jgi:type IX secretion system PorP/SprF family membrane protein